MGGGGSKSKSAPIPREMTQKEIDEAMEKLFGKGTKKSRAEAALPLILESIEQQRMAQLQNVPSIQGIIGQLMQQNPTVSSSAMPQMGILGTLSDLGLQQLSQDNSLATQGMGQIASGQTMNPTILKAKV